MDARGGARSHQRASRSPVSQFSSDRGGRDLPHPKPVGLLWSTVNLGRARHQQEPLLVAEGAIPGRGWSPPPEMTPSYESLVDKLDEAHCKPDDKDQQTRLSSVFHTSPVRHSSLKRQ